MKKIHFIAGMPRSGAHLLINILAQNPDCFPGAPSGLIDVMFQTRNNWETFIDHKAMKWETAKVILKQTLTGIMFSYYTAQTDRPIAFDLNRGWLSHIEMLETVHGEKIKILVPVRDLREILASFEILWRKESRLGQISQERENYVQMQSVAGRCQLWTQDDQPVGMAYNRIADAMLRGYSDRMYFVHYERLCSNPDAEMAGIYDFLGLDYFQHDFDNVKQATVENDRPHGLSGLHQIRPKVEVAVPKSAILGHVSDQYKGDYPWT